MQTVKKIKVINEKLVSVTCDKCGRKMDAQDYTEIQELVSLDEWGGFGSVFGDGAHWQIDICQHCFDEAFGKFIRVVN